MLGYKELVKIFLNYRTKINRTYIDNRVNTLNFAAPKSYYTFEIYRKSISSQSQVFQKLLKKGDKLCQYVIKSLIRKDRELAAFYISV